MPVRIVQKKSGETYQHPPWVRAGRFTFDREETAQKALGVTVLVTNGGAGVPAEALDYNIRSKVKFHSERGDRSNEV